MKLVDVNVLVYVHRRDAPNHAAYLEWWTRAAAAQAFGISGVVLSGFLRVVTHPKIFAPPSTLDSALRFVEEVRLHPNCVPVTPGTRHWDIFLHLCRMTRAAGNRIPDAYLAALAIESGSEWITTDRDYRRFPGLRWKHPLDGDID